MKFEMPFNEKVYRNETNLLFEIDCKYFLKTNKKRLLIGISVLFLFFIMNRILGLFFLQLQSIIL
jgi:hypothetical protein